MAIADQEKYGKLCFGKKLEECEKTTKEFKTVNNESYFKEFVILANPTICWAGTSGYWMEVDINYLLE